MNVMQNAFLLEGQCVELFSSCFCLFRFFFVSSNWLFRPDQSSHVTSQANRGALHNGRPCQQKLEIVWNCLRDWRGSIDLRCAVLADVFVIFVRCLSGVQMFRRQTCRRLQPCRRRWSPVKSAFRRSLLCELSFQELETMEAGYGRAADAQGWVEIVRQDAVLCPLGMNVWASWAFLDVSSCYWVEFGLCCQGDLLHVTLFGCIHIGRRDTNNHGPPLYFSEFARSVTSQTLRFFLNLNQLRINLEST